MTLLVPFFLDMRISKINRRKEYEKMRKKIQKIAILLENHTFCVGLL